MKIAFIADVHSNYYSLNIVLEKIKSLNVNHICCAGDMIGYYIDGDAVISRLRQEAVICVKGNHEKYFLNELGYDNAKEYIYNLKTTLLSPDNLNYIRSLPDEITFEANGRKIYMTHSLPGNCNAYIYNPLTTAIEIPEKTDYYVYGHTHLAGINYSNGVCFINPGSTGQTRDYSQESSFAVLDTTDNMVSIHRCHVDIESYSDKLRKHGIVTEAIDILNRKKKHDEKI